jgi:serine/threonine-protein kinase
MSVSADLARGAVVSGYRIEALLGRGGMGVVYLAEDLRLKRRVALKLLAPQLAENEGFRERFLRESELAASLDHPNVVPIYEAGESEGALYIAMRYVEGADLRTLLAEGRLEPPQGVAIAGQVAEALDAAHERGLVHRDVKPANVLVDRRGNAYLGDFGLTRLLAEPGLGLPAGASLGTPDYVAPEQIRGDELDGRADVYSFGCLLYEILAGKPPFRRDTEVAVLFAHLEEEPPTLPGLEAVLTKALAKSPDERYATCGALLEAARKALGIAAPSRARWPFVLVAVSLAAVAAVSAFFLTRGDGAPVRHLGDGRIVRVDPESGKVVSTSAFGQDLSAASVDADSVWVGSLRTGTLGRIDARTGKLLETISVAGARQGPSAVTAADGLVWIVDGGDDKIRLYRSDERTFSSTEPRLPTAGAAGCACTDLEVPAVARGSVLWAVSAAHKSVERFVPDAISARSTPLNSASDITGLAVGEDAVWAVNTLGSNAVPTLYELDPQTNRVVAKSRLGTGVAPSGVAAGEGAVWIADGLGDVVLRVDPKTLRVAARIPVGSAPAALAVGKGSVWVANNLDGTLSRIDPRTNKVRETLKVGAWPDHVAVGGGSVWVTLDPPSR